MRDENFWKKLWVDHNIAFHQNHFHPDLLRFFPSIPKGKVMVPLCGKSLDLLWLLQQGHQVVGAELSPIACESFFKENKISYQVRVEPGFSVYSAPNLELWCGDFFELPGKAWKDCTAIYDRAALIALPSDLRLKYASGILKNIGENASTPFRMLLITIEYSRTDIQGPPFSVLESEVNTLYGDFFTIQRISEEPELDLMGREKFEGSSVLQKCYLLETKNL